MGYAEQGWMARVFAEDTFVEYTEAEIAERKAKQEQAHQEYVAAHTFKLRLLGVEFEMFIEAEPKEERRYKGQKGFFLAFPADKLPAACLPEGVTLLSWIERMKWQMNQFAVDFIEQDGVYVAKADNEERLQELFKKCVKA